MEKENSMYVIGPRIHVSGKKKTSRIRKALSSITGFHGSFEIGWVRDIPVPDNEGTEEFYLLSKYEGHIEHLPVDFAERLQDILSPPAKSPEE